MLVPQQRWLAESQKEAHEQSRDGVRASGTQPASPPSQFPAGSIGAGGANNLFPAGSLGNPSTS